MAAAPPDDSAILEAVAAGRADMEALLEDLVRAPTVLGAEAPGQDRMRAAFAALGLDPVDVPLDPETLRASPAASPFSWDVEGKASVVAEWAPVDGSDARTGGCSCCWFPGSMVVRAPSWLSNAYSTMRPSVAVSCSASHSGPSAALA